MAIAARAVTSRGCRPSLPAIAFAAAGEELTSLAEVRVNRNVLSAQRTRCFVPGIERDVHERLKPRLIRHVRRRDSAAVAEDTKADDSAASGSRRDHYLLGPSRRW